MKLELDPQAVEPPHQYPMRLPTAFKTTLKTPQKAYGEE